MKLFKVVETCRAYRALENPRNDPYVILLAGTILLSGIMTEFENMLDGKFVFVISPEGEALFLGARDVKEMQDSSA